MRQIGVLAILVASSALAKQPPPPAIDLPGVATGAAGLAQSKHDYVGDQEWAYRSFADMWLFPALGTPQRDKLLKCAAAAKWVATSVNWVSAWDCFQSIPQTPKVVGSSYEGVNAGGTSGVACKKTETEDTYRIECRSW